MPVQVLARVPVQGLLRALVLVPVLVIGIGIGYPLWFYPVL